ncbi:MAG: hypothetical protein A2015_15385 [Spirochaetes bacterium GWF1_31_7]|nr:MAG: hypothetical protein A2Y30_11805 [Spirochaetes bacterium GWE1_32_154]OHD47248.1 MAG: hypothetical protein A2Y29_02820 [Spirochaetes bacterium GWE2_31_10]OHD52120.1 MAG: hypothetical protein A2015_15385 [Spirochaetes bacterium GWF1_31_7]
MLPIIFIPALILLSVRIIGLNHLKLTRKFLLKIGVLPVRNHYYEPFFDARFLAKPLFEYLELLPTLNKGVIVHIHDIFSPKNYPESWDIDEVKLWNEQYLLEAFLTTTTNNNNNNNNNKWKIIVALNYLHHTNFDKLQSKCPRLTRDREPGSFYMIKV